ncbi:MAG: cyclic peptide export ABC transporter [Acidimicrobiia bacterium]|nr:cyclic peptide export ABC transporter [Acidimicrobiia bacterium]
MKLLELLRRESTVSMRGLLLLAGVAGISNALVLAVINTATGGMQAGAAGTSSSTASGAAQAVTTGNGRYALLFIVIMAIYAVSQLRLYTSATSEIEKILDRVRVRVADKIRRCELLPVEEIGQTLIYAGVTKETQTISQAATLVIMAAQAGVLVVFTAFYVAYLSLIAFLLTATITVILSFIHVRRSRAMNVVMHELSVRENDLFDTLRHFLDGFKEVRMNRGRSDDLFAHFTRISSEATARKCYTHEQIARTFIFSQLSFYALLGVIVFLVPRLSQTYSDSVVNITAAVLFLIGPITTIVGTVPNLAVADAAVDNVASLESSLDRALSSGFDRLAPKHGFREIAFEDVVFHYEDGDTREAFTVGPINLTLKAGESVFIAGGNGSGKSTFLRLLTSLYHPQQGVIRVDGVVLRPEAYESYRSLFSAVFTDYHLFDRLYGLAGVPQAEIDGTIEHLELTGKVRVEDGRFDTLDLSGGQRKRLALLVSLLEDRPVYVFDEMAADQDPAFRRKFYEEILVELTAGGRTVVAVTHDDKYFGAADRLLKMDEGRFVSDARA